MSYTPGSLADGQLSSTAAVIYTVPASTVAVLSMVSVFNTSASVSETVGLYVTRSGGTRRQIAEVELAAREYAYLDLRGIPLSTGDSLDGGTDTTATVDYVVGGATR